MVLWVAGNTGAINNGGFDRFSTSSNDINQLFRLKIRADQYWRGRDEKNPAQRRDKQDNYNYFLLVRVLYVNINPSD